MSKSSQYNAMMQYVSYSLLARLRFSRCMHEHSSARFQSASRVKMWGCVSFRERDFVRTFQKRRKKPPLSSQPFFLHVLLGLGSGFVLGFTTDDIIRVTKPNPNPKWQLYKYKSSVTFDL